MLELVGQFMNAGGEVLYLIAALTFFMWTLIFERLWYLYASVNTDVAAAVAQWQGRSEHSSWYAHKIRLLLISRTEILIRDNLPMIRAMVAICPLFGLLGTVWGMIDVFNVMAFTGGAEVKAMASGVSKATIPTMAGMVSALSGVFANTFLTNMASRKLSFLEDALTLES